MSDNKLTYTIAEVSQLLGIHPNSTRKFVLDGTLPSLRLGRKILIPRAALERLLGADTDDKNPAGDGGERR